MAYTVISSGQASGGSYPHLIKIYIGVELASQDVAANKSTIRIKAWMVNETKGTPWNTWPGDNPYYLKVDGSTIKSGTQFVDFRKSRTHVIAEETITRTHNASGDLTLTIEARQAITDVSTFSYAYRKGTYSAPRIVRASSITAQDGFVDDPIAISISKAAGVYNHDLELWIGSTKIATRANITTASSMTLTSGEWSTFYTASKDNATIWPMLKLISKLSNGTVLDYRAVYPALTYKETVVPTFTSVTATDGNTKVVNIMGAGNFVRSLSNITAKINGAAGAKASTIKAYELTVDGTKYTSASRLFTPQRSGSIPISARVQDSRGRWSTSKSININVAPYSPPTIKNYSIDRVNSNGTANQLGTYSRHTATATVASMKVGSTEKNQLRYYIQNVTGTPSTVLSTQTVVGLSRSLNHVLGTYAIDKSYTFRLVALDKFDQSYAVDITLPDARVPFSWGPYGGSFGGIFDTADPAVLQVSGDVNIKGGQLKIDGVPRPMDQIIPANADLNDYKTPGTYYCPANATVATLANRPTNNAFSLIVTKHAGVAQLLIPYMTNSHDVLHRNLYGSTWGDWQTITGGSMTAAQIKAALLTVDGSGSSIDADLLDGLHASSFERVYSRGGNHLNGWEDLPGNMRRVWKTYTTTVLGSSMTATGPTGAYKSGWLSPGNWANTFTAAPRVNVTLTTTNGAWIFIGPMKDPTATACGDFFIYKFATTDSGVKLFVEAVGPR